MKKRKLGLLVTLAALALTSTMAFAEGSRELTANGGNRPYLEWYPNASTCGITRINTMKVFAKAGETIKFGSSVDSVHDINNKITGEDIVVQYPNGDKQSFDVLETGEGYIDSIEKERIGAYPENGGYTPFEIKVTQTGIYKLQFKSPWGYKSGQDTNPANVLSTAPMPLKSQITCVASFDASVFDADGNEVKGRGYFDYISMNVGKNQVGKRSLESDFYILTNDGYQYKINMNGIDPYGFVMFANNRGFIDPTSNTSLYKTMIGLNNSMSNVLGNIKMLLPTEENTNTNITHKVFLNQPASDLPDSIPTVAEAPAEISKLSFVGTEDGKSSEGNGGMFYIDLSKDTTYSISIDADNNGSTDDAVDVILSNAGVAGSNSIYWNGLDGEGNKLPAGSYTVYANAKGGEYHFPLLDAENSKDGIKVQLLNAPYEYDGFDATEIFYDDSAYTTAGGVYVYTRRYYTEGKSDSGKAESKIYPVSALDGVSSNDGAFVYNNAYGDQKGFDFWTYFPGGKATSSIEVTKETAPVSTVSGYVFFDKNKNADFDVAEKGLGNVTIKIIDANKEEKTVTTDAAGHYSAVIAVGDYTLSVDNAPDGYVLTTNNDTITGKTVSGVNYIENIGYYLGIDVGVEITASKEELMVDETIEFVITAYNHSSLAAELVSVDAPLPSYAEFVSCDSSLYDRQTGYWNVGVLAPGESKSITVVATILKDGNYKYPVFITAEEDISEDNNSSMITYVAAKKPVKPEITVEVPSYVIPQLECNFAYIFGRSDTEMQAEDSIRRGESCAVIHRLMKQNELLGSFTYDESQTPLFYDITGRWDRSAVEFLVNRGAYTANPEGNVYPDRPTTRGEAFKLFCLGLGFTEDASLSNEQYAAILVDAGFVEGYDDGTLRLENTINRAEFCKIYNLIINRKFAKLVTKDGEEITANTYNFNDLDSAQWYYNEMLKATSAYDEGYVDLAMRNKRNELDDYITE